MISQVLDLYFPHRWPSRANKSFPYHVKTNHIGIASDDDDGADYPRHTYEPSTTDASIIIPLSRRTEEFITKGIQNPAFIRDIDYFRNNGPTSIPQQCLPSRSVHHRLPSPTNEPNPFNNTKLYGNDTLNDDDEEDSNIDAESGIMKQDSCETLRHTISSSDVTDNKPSATNDFNSRQSSQDNDSGHLSLEVSTSPNSTTPPDRSLQPPPLAPIMKENPFKINSAKAPNKIILDPIQLPDRKVHLESNNVSNVPRHLFTVKKT